MTPYLTEIVVAIFGLCIGSFINVCIYRIPQKKSIVSPGSRCPDCETPIRFYDNIPVISYLWLKGKCRYCGVRISARYPMVEILSGAFAFLISLKFGISIEGLIWYAFTSVLLLITYIDHDHQIIPDVITLPGIPIAFLASLFLPQISWLESVLGILIGGGILYLIAVLYTLLTKKEGMGGGDIKLLALIGAAIGWKGVLFTIFLASLVGAVSGILVMIQQKGNFKLAVPFGPFLSIGAISYIFFGMELISWYFQLLR